MAFDLVEINTAMDLIKEDIIKELSESLGDKTSDEVNEKISYET